MAYQLVGKLKMIKDLEQISETFRKREFVVTVQDGDYPQDIMFQSANKNSDAINSFAVGSDVSVTFNLRGREWTSPQGEVKHFNTLDAWRIEAATMQAPAQGAPAQGAPANFPTGQVPVDPGYDSSGDDDLPF